MFDTQPRRHRHPFQSAGFWLLLGAGAALLGAWEFDIFPLQTSTSYPYPLVEEELPPPTDEGTEENFHVIPSPSDVAPLDLERRAGESVVVAASYEAPPVHAAAESGTIPLNPVEQLQQARQLLRTGDEIGAHRLYSSVYWQHPELTAEFFEEMNALATRIYFEPSPHYLPPYQVDFGERLEVIARQHEVPWEYLAKLNGVDPHRIKSGQKLKVLQGPFSAVVDQDRMTLTIHAYGYFVRQFPIGIGRDGATPVGTFLVVDKLANPTYYGPDGVIAENDPGNPLGERWLAINDEVGTLSGYGIHGTNEPESIGKAESRGCIRLGTADVEQVYDLLSVGSEVVIRGKR